MNNQRVILLLVLLTGVSLGVFAATQLFSGQADEPAAQTVATESVAPQILQSDPGDLSAEQLAQVVESLVRTIDEEISERQVLEEEIDRLRNEVASLRTRMGIPTEDDIRSRMRGVDEQTRERMLEQNLIDSGFTRAEIETVERLVAEAAMEQIALDDRARREGWLNTPQYFEEANALADTGDVVRDYLGDDGFDRYLYSVGTPNRVAVGSVIETSPAEQAGLRPGDVILSYGGQRVFQTGELIEMRSAGNSGEPVSLVIVRDGQRMQLTIPRGPMGVNTRPTRMEPGSTGGQ